MYGYITLLLICLIISIFSPNANGRFIELIRRVEFLEKFYRETKYRTLSKEMDKELEKIEPEPLLKQVAKKDDINIVGSYNPKIRLYTAIPEWQGTASTIWIINNLQIILDKWQYR